METLTELRLAEIRDAIEKQNDILEQIRDAILNLPDKILEKTSDADNSWWED